MPSQPATCVLRHVRHLIGGLQDEETDGQLIDRFLSRQDESAFEALVRRHGPMVLRTCKKVLGDAHLAEDAFQAAFLVLARKAGSIRNHGSVAGYLYEVAYHLALRARTQAARRQSLVRDASQQRVSAERSGDEMEDYELRDAVSEELTNLPDLYRTPLVLCYLEGKTNAQAAHELGWPTGSMSARLARARELLRDRLAGRGIALSAGGVALVLAEDAAAAVPAALVKSTVVAATSYAAGKMAQGLVSAQAIALAEGMRNTMMTIQMKLAAAVLLAVAVLGAGSGVVLLQQPAVAQQADPKAPQAADQANPADQYGDPLPQGALARMGTLRWRHGGSVYFVGFTAEGKQLVTASADGLFRVWDLANGKEVRKFGKGVVQAGAGGNAQIMVNGGVAMAMPLQMIRGVDLTADGKVLGIANQDGTIQLYDVEQGKELRTIRNPRGAVMGLTFSPDGKTLVAKGTDQQLSRWETESGKELPRIGQPADPKRRIYFGGGQGNTVAFAPDGKTLASAAMEIDNNRAVGLVQIFDVESGKEVRTIKGPQNAYAQSLAFAGKTLAWAGTDGTIRLYNADDGKELRTVGQQQQGRYYSTLILSPDGKTLAGRMVNASAIQLWDVESGKDLRNLGDDPQPNNFNVFARAMPIQGNANSIAFSPDGKTLAEGLPTNTIRLWEVATGKEVLPVVGHQGGVSNLGVTPDGKTLITRGTDNSIRSWDIASGKELRSFKLPAGTGNADLSADGKIVVFGGPNNTVHIWDVAQGKELRQVPIQAQQNFGNVPAGMGGLSISPDGKITAVRGYDQIVYLIETGTGKVLPPLADANPNPNGGIVIVGGSGGFGGKSSVFTFSPDGTMLATIGMSQQAMLRLQGVQPPAGARNPAGVITLWSTSTGRLARRFESQQRTVSDLIFSPDGQTLATANGDQTVSIWEVATGKELFSFKTNQPALNQQQQQQRMAMGYPPTGSVAMTFSPDGRFLAMGGMDNTIRVYDVRDGKELGKFAGHEGSIMALAFAPNGRTILSGSNDTTALAWDGGAMLATAARPVVDLKDDEVKNLWSDLASQDGAKVYKAITTLSAAPKQAVPLFKQQVKPEPGIAAEKIEAMIKDLDSNDFNVRQKADEDLEKLGPLALPAFKKVLESGPALETRQRVEKLVQRLETNAEPPPDQLRAIRVVRILEWLGDADAREVLDTLAKGAAGARLTVDAQEAVERLSKRSK